MEPNMAPCSERFEVVAETWRGIAQHFHGSLGELDTYRALVCFQVDDITVSMVLNTSPETFAANKTLFDEITKSVRVEAFGNHPLPAHTLLTISQVAWPGMIVEIDVTAIVAK